MDRFDNAFKNGAKRFLSVHMLNKDFNDDNLMKEYNRLFVIDLLNELNTLELKEVAEHIVKKYGDNKNDN